MNNYGYKEVITGGADLFAPGGLKGGGGGGATILRFKEFISRNFYVICRVPEERENIYFL